ncbi:unnamed protein product [Acanthoscelides obtectus]|nr:unnamed protein product [Acanthoscelides obtectus]CAK1675038.1 hypothetical protein AOBTE_LOCUS29866 [Acanthoscelides obtectus]
MDEILSRKHALRPDIYKDNVFDGPRCEDIKVEIMDDIECNEDSLQGGSSTMNNDSEADGEFEEEAAHPMARLTSKPPKSSQQPAVSKPATSTQSKSKTMDSLPRIMPKPVSELQAPRITTTTPASTNVNAKVQIPIQAGIRPPNGNGPTIPFPLLILNGLPGQNQQHQQTQMPKKDVTPNMPTAESNRNPESSHLLQSLLNVQTEQLQIQNQRLKLEKQQLKLNQLLTTQLLVLLPTLKNLMYRLVAREEQHSETDEKTGKKRKLEKEDEDDSLADCKVLKNMLEDGIKKYMLESMDESDDDDDSGIHKDVDK